MNDTASDTCSLVCSVACGIRNDAPARMLGNVYCGSVAAGLVSLRYVLRLTLRSFTAVDPLRVHEPSTPFVTVLRGLALSLGPDRALQCAGALCRWPVRPSTAP
jgi:hypothetical protein